MPLEKIPSHVQAAKKRGDIEALIAMGRKGAEARKRNRTVQEEAEEKLREYLDEQRRIEAENMIKERHGDPEN